jgi:hypothetical protein
VEGRFRDARLATDIGDRRTGFFIASPSSEGNVEATFRPS